jgi:hypothetical protein
MIYIVKEKRSSIALYEIEAASEEDARQRNGKILDSFELDEWPEYIISCEEK